MARYDYRHGAVATADTVTELTDRGSDGTAMDPIKVQPGERSIKQLWPVYGNEAATLTACGGPTTIRISGTGVDGVHEFPAPGWAMLNTSNAAFAFYRPAVPYDVEIGLIPGGNIDIYAACDGTDMGTPNPGCGLTITGLSPRAKGIRYETALASITAVATSTAFALRMGTVTRNSINPGNAKKITRLFTTYSNELPLVTAAGGTCFGTIVGGIENGPFPFVCGGHSTLGTTTGTGGGIYPIADSGLLEILLNGNNISLVGEQSGDDHGTAMPSVCMELSP